MEALGAEMEVDPYLVVELLSPLSPLELGQASPLLNLPSPPPLPAAEPLRRRLQAASQRLQSAAVQAPSPQQGQEQEGAPSRCWSSDSWDVQ